jgi:dCTP deaminase
MRLSDTDIKQAVKNNFIKISPSVDSSTIEGIAIDLQLGNKFRGFRASACPYIDLAGSSTELKKSLESVMDEQQELTAAQRYILHPGELVIAVTHQRVTLANNIVGWLDGRSSLARLGLMVHVTSHRIDPGWDGHIVLECFNSGKVPLALAPMMKICALNFEMLSSEVESPYAKRKNAKYRNQNEARPSLLSQESS